MALSSLPSLALALLALVTLTGGVAFSRSHAVVGVATDDGVPPPPPPEDQELLLTTMERFHGWMARHGRSYTTTEEKLRRLEIYRRNVLFIEAANRDGRLTYTLGENAFTDLTHEEFLAMHTSRAPRPDLMTTSAEDAMVITTRAGHVSDGGAFLLPGADVVPDSVNWTAKGKVTEVKNQGLCSACWAFAAVATIESAYSIAKGVEPVALSEQELIDCDSYDHGCTSGSALRALKWVKQNGSITLQKSYPYAGYKHSACLKNRQDDHPIQLDAVAVSEGSEELLMQAVARQPVAVAFDSNDPCFRHYRSGVYNGMCIKDGEYVGPCSYWNLSHAMAIVGYGEKKWGDLREKYWIAKNSWGKGWGDHGYVLLKKDVGDRKGICGIVRTQPAYPFIAQQ